MLYLPSGVDSFVSQRADEAQMNKGQYMIGIIVAWAEKNGFECDHPKSFQKFYKGVKHTGTGRPQFRCMRCGKILERVSTL